MCFNALAREYQGCEYAKDEAGQHRILSEIGLPFIPELIRRKDALFAIEQAEDYKELVYRLSSELEDLEDAAYYCNPCGHTIEPDENYAVRRQQKEAHFLDDIDREGDKKRRKVEQHRVDSFIFPDYGCGDGDERLQEQAAAASSSSVTG